MSPTRWSQISEVLERALELPAQARPAFLAEACGEEAELRAEVESLLGAHQAAGESFLADDELARQAAETLPFQPPDLSGQSIKQFVLLRRIGMGGMGEVYLANDTSLRRQVALKLLPAQTSLEDERLRLFAREARAASSLNHPNITTVYEFGQENGRHFIVTEYVEGQTLRERLAQGSLGLPLSLPVSLPLSLEETLTIADQVLAALGAAHAAGIIHRDIKPENLMLRSDGVVKVLDFGIAKLLPRAREEATGRAAATRFLSTQQGTVLGTPGYMSPEQVRGLDVTTRSDLFSFGVVFYELLVGQLPFQGETKADFIAKVLTTEPPPLTQLRPDLPPAYDALLQQLLAKDPVQRLGTASEVSQALARLPHQTLSQPAARWEQLRRAKRQLAWAVSVLFVLSALGGGAWHWRKNNREMELLKAWSDLARVRHENIYTNKLGQEFASLAFSPDGQAIVFDMREDDVPHLYRLPRSGGMPQPLTFGTATDRSPVWSPDGRDLAFISNRSGSGEWGIWRLPQSGGEPELLCTLPSRAAELLTWRNEASGQRLYFVMNQNLHAMNPAMNQRDRKIEVLTRFPPLKPERNSFSLSPEGQRLVYLESRDRVVHLNLFDLSNGSLTTLFAKTEEVRSPRWLADGKHLVFISEVSGNFQPQLYSLAQQQTVPLNLGSDDFIELAVASDGRTLLGQSKNENANIYAIDLQGQESALTTEIGAHYLPVPSPDGERFLFQASTGHYRRGGRLLEKSLRKIAGGEMRVRGEGVIEAEWAPNGDWLAYATQEGEHRELYLQNPEGTATRLVANGLAAFWLQPLPYNLISQGFSWTPDSRRLVYVGSEANSNQLWQVEAAGLTVPRTLAPLSPPNTFYLSPACVPQSERVAFISLDTGRDTGTATQDEPKGQVLIAENNQIILLHKTNSWLQMVGWLHNDEKLLVAEGQHSASGKVQDATLLKCDVSARQCQPVTLLRDVFLPSLQLSPDKTTVAYVVQFRRSLNIRLFSLGTHQTKSLTTNSDPTLFYAGLHWANNSQKLFFSKQTSFEILHLLELR